MNAAPIGYNLLRLQEVQAAEITSVGEALRFNTFRENSGFGQALIIKFQSMKALVIIAIAYAYMSTYRYIFGQPML